jgi:beta-galactosidase
MDWPRGVTGLCYGGDYNPEQWPDEVWAQDAVLMREAGVNLVSLGVFAWSWLEPTEGRYDFDWLDRAMDLLYDAGVRVALATPTASPPPWFSLAHPDALPVNRDGVRLSHGSRDTYCASAPAYRAAAARIATALATRYADHPALAMWHVHNEYGTSCHCDVTAEAFRRWLRGRHGDLAGLNEAWTTAFWGQRYSDWAQVRPPRATQYLANPTQELDFRRFTSDELLAAYVEQRDALRAITPDVPVTTNFVFGDWVPVDHWRWAAEVDLVAVDHYPDDAGTGEQEQGAFAADLARGWAGGRAWLLMETAPNLIYTAGRMHTKEPGRMLRQSLAAVARGSRGAMFFQWRAPAGGAERFHSALVPHAGPDSRVFAEAVELGAALRAVAEADTAPVDNAGVAILWDAPSWWALQGPGLPAPMDYLAQVRAAHRALWRLGMTTDFAAPGAFGRPLSAYAMVLCPALYLAPDAAAEALLAYVAGGGHLVVTPWSGIADEHARVRLGGYPGALRDVLGVRVEQWHPLPDGEIVALSDGAHGTSWRETVHVTGASAVATYADGTPAITTHRYGDGVAWYVSTRLTDDSYAGLVATVARAAGAAPAAPGLPTGVEAVRRRAGTASWLFVLNHTASPVTVEATGVDLLTGAELAGPTRIPAGGVVVVREKRFN